MEVISLDESSSDEDLPNFSQSFKRSKVTVDSREMNPVNTAVYNSTCHHDQAPLLHANEKQKKKALDKAKREEEKARKRKEKEMDRARDRAIRKAEKDSRVEARAGERQKQMIVLLDREMSENSTFMHEFALRMAEYDIKYHITFHPTPTTIRWKRVTSHRSVDESAKTTVNFEEIPEKHVLLHVEADAFALVVADDKCERMGQCSQSSLSTYIGNLKSAYEEHNITLVVCGMEAYYRNNKTRKNRQFREQVRGSNSSSSSQKTLSDVPVVTKEDVLEAVVKLQLYFNCVVRFIEKIVELPDVVVNYTRAIADIPYKKDAVFSFHTEQSYGTSKKDTGQETPITWQHMLMQFNSVSSHIASAIVEVYPTPFSLYKAYSKCGSVKEAELLLQDILVRRGVGVTATSRRVGPALSCKVHSFLTCSNGDQLLQ